MKIVIAPDSFKESLSAAGVAEAIAAGVREGWSDAECVLVPMSDGGEGMVAAVLAAAGGRRVECDVTGPMGERVRASFGVLPDGATAVVEMAVASGLELVPEDKRDPMRATSFGTGEVIAAALGEGVRRVVLGLGGSATVDGGAGMLQALGVRLLDEGGAEIPRGGAGLERVAKVDLSGLDARVRGVEIEVAGDVDNPLVGEHGAAAVFGPQKGASAQDVRRLEAGLVRFAEVVKRDVGMEIAQMPGAGAAGGTGGAAVACLRAKLRPGVELVAGLVGLEDAVRGAGLVITGEGRMDGQSVRGKTPIGVAAVARRHGVPVVALAGSLGPGWQRVLDAGIDAAWSIVPGPVSREEAYAGTAANLRAAARGVAALLRRVQDQGGGLGLRLGGVKE